MDDDELHESFYRSEQYKESPTERLARQMTACPHDPDRIENDEVASDEHDRACLGIETG
jgi:hypothetical protein